MSDELESNPNSSGIESKNVNSVITNDAGRIIVSNAYDKKEFIASTDPNFRPINSATGPDGSLYIVDMYRGIVQHGPYMSPYLREVSLNRKLDKPINLGRIWRIVPKQAWGLESEHFLAGFQVFNCRCKRRHGSRNCRFSKLFRICVNLSLPLIIRYDFLTLIKL